MTTHSHDFEDPNLPLYPGTLRGYRWWTTFSGVANSLAFPTHAWEHSVTVARCFRFQHHDTPAPVQGCKCGLYAWHHPRHDNDGGRLRHILCHFYAFGVVSAWGKIIPGTRGFKAEQAKIEAVWLAPPSQDAFKGEATLTHKTFKANHPHLRFFDTKEDLLAAYPPQEVEWSKP